jgi:hypothetical protein
VVHGRAFLEDRKKVALPRKMNPWYMSSGMVAQENLGKERDSRSEKDESSD